MNELQEKENEYTEYSSSTDVETTTIDAEKAYPSELKDYNQWILWKLEEPEDGKQKKIPYSTGGYKASVTNPENWSSFDEAFETYKEKTGTYSGIGFVFTQEDPFIGIDYDHEEVKSYTFA